MGHESRATSKNAGRGKFLCAAGNALHGLLTVSFTEEGQSALGGFGGLCCCIFKLRHELTPCFCTAP